MQQSFVLRYSKVWQQKVINMELTFLILENKKRRYEITFTLYVLNEMKRNILYDNRIHFI